MKTKTRIVGLSAWVRAFFVRFVRFVRFVGSLVSALGVPIPVLLILKMLFFSLSVLSLSVFAGSCSWLFLFLWTELWEVELFVSVELVVSFSDLRNVSVGSKGWSQSEFGCKVCRIEIMSFRRRSKKGRDHHGQTENIKHGAKYQSLHPKCHETSDRASL